MSGEGALKCFKLATPMRRMRVCPWMDPQPRDFTVSLLECGAAARSVGLCGVFFGSRPLPSTVGHSFWWDEMIAVFACSRTNAEKKNKTSVTSSITGARKDLHRFHDLFHNPGTAEATRDVTT